MRVKFRHFLLCFAGALIFGRGFHNFEGLTEAGVHVAKLACGFTAVACWHFALRWSAVAFGQQVQDECNALRPDGGRFTWRDGCP